MSQSIARVVVHIIFSVKGRKRILTESICKELYPYMATVIQNLDCRVIAIGGVEDHVHILCVLSRRITLAKLVEDVKKPSSKWLKTKGQEYSDFHWQNGYGAFSVSESNVNQVTAYIENQKEHHHRRTFKEELLVFLKKHNVQYDERYLFD